MKITNYRRLEDVSFKFSKGITIISGLNGAGKSTLFEAVAWSLFGQTASRTGAKAVIGSYLPATAKCQVLLDFNLDGQNYHIEREVDSKGSGNAAISVGNQELANGVSAVNSFICNLLGLDYRSFQTSFYAKQNELNYLANIQPAQRLKHLINMLGLNRLDKTVELISKDRLKAEALVSVLGEIDDKTDFKQEIKDKEGILNKKTEEFQELKANNSELLKLLKEKETILRDLKQELAKNSKLKEEIDSLKDQNQKFKKHSKEINDQVVEIKQFTISEESLIAEKNKIGNGQELQQKLQKLSDYQKKRKQLDSDLSSLTTELTSKQNDLLIINNNIASTNHNSKRQNELELLSVELNDTNIQINTQINDKRNELSRLKNEFSDIENELEQLDDVEGEKKCPTCLRPFGDDFQEFKKHLQEKCNLLQNKIIALTKEGKALRSNLDSLQIEKNETDKQLAEQRKFHNDLQSWQAKSSVIEKIVADLEIKTAAIQFKIDNHPQVDNTECQQLQNNYERLNRISKQLHEIELQKVQLPLLLKQIDSIDNNIINNNINLKQLESKLHSVDSLEHKEDLLNNELLDLQGKHHKISKKIENLNEDLINLERDIADLKQKKKQNQEKELQIKEANSNSKQLKQLQKIFKELKTDLTSRIQPEFERISSQLLSDISNGRYNRLELDSSYNLSVYDNNDCYSLERYSGGEQDLFNICLRLAIALYLGKTTGHEYSFIVLDEIFGSQDRFRQEAILQMLDGLKKHFRQIFLITHIDEIKNRAANLIEIERHGEISKVYPSY